MRDGEWGCDDNFAIRPPDCNFSNEDSLECAMYRAVCGSDSPALTALSRASSSSSFIGDRGENFRVS